MNRHSVEQLLTVVEHPEKVAELFSALSTERRIRTFHQLFEDTPPKQIADELGVSRSALQPYLNDFKNADLVTVDGKEYVFTSKGEQVYNLIESVDALHSDLSKLQEFLVENPEIIPEEVLKEIEVRKKDE